VAPVHVDLVRAICAPWARGDFSSVAWADPEIEWVIADGPEPGTRNGIPQMLEGWRDVLSAWEEWHAELEECRELDGERVLALFHFGARGKASGIDVADVATKGASVFHVRDGRVTRLVLYWDRERALADLAPEAG
jgi:ketosteroid isomerase-like protein